MGNAVKLFRSSRLKSFDEFREQAAQSVNDKELAWTLKMVNENEEVYSKAPGYWALRAGLYIDYDIPEGLKSLDRSIALGVPEDDGCHCLAYALERAAQYRPDKLHDYIAHLGQAPAAGDSGECLAALSNLKRMSGQLAEAEDLAKRALALAPESMFANLAAAWCAIGSGDTHKGFEHTRRALRLRPREAWWHLYASPFSNFLELCRASVEAEEQIVALLEEEYYKDPLLNLLPVRPTVWHYEKLRAQRESCIAKGLPSCLFVTMFKSGSVAVGSILNSGFGLPTVLYSINIQRIVDCWLQDYLRGGACNVTHLNPRPRNQAALKKGGAKSLIINMRDPRQFVISMSHHILRYQKHLFYPRNDGYFDLNATRQIDYVVNSILPNVLVWMERWLTARSEFDITVTTYEQFRSDRQGFIEKILSAYGGDRAHFNPDAVLSQDINIDYHYRSAQLREWEQILTPGQLEKINSMIPPLVAREFGI